MRIFVTLALILGTAACETKHSPKQSVLDDGQAKLAESDRVEQELKADNIELSQDVKEQTASGFWSPLSKGERRVVKQKLLRYIVLTSQVLEMETQKGLYLTHRDQVISKRNAAIEIESGCEDFEKLMGPAYDGKDVQPGLKMQR